MLQSFQWIVEDEYKKIEKMKQKYVFGHFELPYFKMNAMVEMPDVGTIQAEHFAGCGKVFSGHFHKRQNMKNVTYMGNAFPHNYADAWDDDRGMMVLEWGGEPKIYKLAGDAKIYHNKNKELLEDPEKYLKPKMYVRVTLDMKFSMKKQTSIEKHS